MAAVHGVLVSLLFVLFAVSSYAQNCPVHSVCFAIDTSGSQTASDFNTEINAVRRIASLVDQAPVRPRYSALTFSRSSNIIQQPTVNLFEFNAALDEAQRTTTPMGSTNIFQALQTCGNTIRSSPGKRIIVLLSDGFGSNPNGVRQLANSLRNEDIKIVTVGIGSFSVNSNFLKEIAFRPQFFFSTTFSTILRDANAIANRCFAAACIRPTVPRSCRQASYLCRFKFQTGPPVPLIDISFNPDRALTPKIVSKSSERLGIINTNGMLVQFLNQAGSGASKITNFGKPRFSPTHFKPFRIGNVGDDSGVGHQSFNGNQLMVARNRCVRIFFTQYQVLTGTTPPYVKKNVVAKMSDRQCVVFYTY